MVPILALVLDKFWSYELYLTTAIWSWLPLRTQAMFLIVYQSHFWPILMLDNICQKRKLCDPFLWMEFHCLKATEPLWGDGETVSFLPKVPKGLSYSFYQPWKEERLSQSWSHPVVLNWGPLKSKSSARTTRPLQD